MKSYRVVLSALTSALLVTASTLASAQSTQMQQGQEPMQAAPGAAAATTERGMAGSSGASTGGAATGTGGPATVTVPMVILVPVAAQQDQQLNNGCWVRLNDKDAKPGQGNDILTIVGQMYMPSFKTPMGIDWSRKADSMTVGPNAAVRIFSDQYYKGNSATLRGGQQVKDLNQELGFVKSIDSLQVDCQG